MALVEVVDLWKSFAHRVAVQGVSLAIERGEIIAFLGPNGSGKTTTMRLIAGLLRPDRGSGTVLGFDLRTEIWSIRKHIGYMAQHISLYDDLTVEENLRFAARSYGMANVGNAVAESIERFGLARYARHLVEELSGGWKHRVAIACALQHAPKLLLLDEPTSGVDPESRQLFWQTIQEEAAKGTAVLVSTHHLDEVEQYADRLIYILQGRIIAQGALADVVHASRLFAVRLEGADRARWQMVRKRYPSLYVALTTDALWLAGEDAALVRRAAKEVGKGLVMHEVPPRLEEVFLHLVRRQEKAA